MRRRARRARTGLVRVVTTIAGVAWLTWGGAEAPPPRDVVPDVRVGAQVYAERCAACHGSYAYDFGEGTEVYGEPGGNALGPDFTRRAWRTALSPADVAAAVRGEGDHPAAATSVEESWHAVAFVWTLPMPREDIARGVELVDRAVQHAKGKGFMPLLLQGRQITELQNRAWVMTHTPEEVLQHFRSIAGEEIESLDEEEQQVLTDHVHITHFRVPDGWRPW